MQEKRSQEKREGTEEGRKEEMIEEMEGERTVEVQIEASEGDLDHGKLPCVELFFLYLKLIVFCLSDRRDDRRGGSRDRGDRGDRGRRSPSGPEHNSMSIPTWKPKKARQSNFDLKPPPGVELPPIGVVTPMNGIPNSYLSFSNNPLQMVKEAKSMGDKVTTTRQMA